MSIEPQRRDASHQTGIVEYVRAHGRGQLASAVWVGHRPPPRGNKRQLMLVSDREQLLERPHDPRRFSHAWNAVPLISPVQRRPCFCLARCNHITQGQVTDHDRPLARLYAPVVANYPHRTESRRSWSALGGELISPASRAQASNVSSFAICAYCPTVSAIDCQSCPFERCRLIGVQEPMVRRPHGFSREPPWAEHDRHC
jgi:hypothetical protein